MKSTPCQLLLIVALLLGACASTPVEDGGDEAVTTAPEAVEAAPAAAEAEKPTEYGNFTRDQLAQAILSELGGQRGHFQEALRGYQQLALETRDPGVIRRALQYASAMGETAMVLELAALWSDIEPGNIEPQLLLGYQHLESGDFDQALLHMQRVIELGGNADFTALTARTEDIPATRRAHIRSQIDMLRARYPQELSLHFAYIQLLDQDGDLEAALQELQSLREQRGDSAQMVLIHAQLLQELGQAQQALEALGEGVAAFPGNRVLRFSYAQLLIRNEDLDAAREQFMTLVRQEPEDYETMYSLALLNLEMEALNEARSLFSRLLDIGYRNNESRFYLGYIDETQGRINAAIGNYRQVQMSSNNYLNAQRQVIRLLVAEQRFDEAHQWAEQLSRAQPRLGNLFTSIEADALMAAEHYDRAAALLDAALRRSPDNVDLLFARTLLNDRRGDLAAVERDLRQMIQINPNDARALNHLGYTLTDRTDRHEEALHLIERAIALEPDDPAIIDSLGWVQYKLGHHEQALVNLRRALELFPDHEVAAHLGEVLWVMGHRQEALQVWNEALARDPDSELLREVMQRLRPGSQES